jgi:hypothetical protein
MSGNKKYPRKEKMLKIFHNFSYKNRILLEENRMIRNLKINLIKEDQREEKISLIEENPKEEIINSKKQDPTIL